VPERYLGQTLGKYRIERLLGSGGFAWVFKGYDPELDIPVAVKVLKPQYANEHQVVERFRREASTAARLRHPNIIKIYAVGREGDAVYFVMDYLTGGLSDRLETTACLPEDYVIRVGIDVARALGFAHREGVIHRDIKVDNILFDSHGNAVVADFGIARAVSGYTNQTGTNMVVGTPQYFAPEQARAKPLDGRADIYSLGVTLYRAATGRLPFEGEDWYEIARQHVEEPPPPPRSINESLTPEFEAIVLQCLSKSPNDRPATGELLADTFDAILQARRDPTAASTVTVPIAPGATPSSPRHSRQVARPTPRKQLIPAAIIATVVIVGLAAVIARPFGTPVATGTPADSVLADSLADSTARVVPPVVAGDTGTRPPPTTGRGQTKLPTARLGSLRVTAPLEADVSIDGTLIGKGEVRRDSLPPKQYLIRAEIPSFAGCDVNRVTRFVQVEAGQTQAVALNPRGCGSLMFQAAGTRVDGSRVEGLIIHFSLRPEGGEFSPEQRLPLSGPLVLPAGKWDLRLSAQRCRGYDETIELAPGQAKTLPTIALEC
jgi:serine/threonine-protein kinase